MTRNGRTMNYSYYSFRWNGLYYLLSNFDLIENVMDLLSILLAVTVFLSIPKTKIF